MTNLVPVNFTSDVNESMALLVATNNASEQIISVAAGARHSITTPSSAFAVVAEEFITVDVTAGGTTTTYAKVLNLCIDVESDTTLSLVNPNSKSVKVNYVTVNRTTPITSQLVSSVLAKWVICKNDGESVQGPQGKSAYQVAHEGGFSGTEAQWLKSLEGRSAYAVATAGGYSGSESQWLLSLKGDQGKSAYQLARDGGFVGTESQWLESLRGRDVNYNAGSYLGYNIPVKPTPDANKPDETGKVTNMEQTVNHCFNFAHQGKVALWAAGVRAKLPINTGMTFHQIADIVGNISGNPTVKTMTRPDTTAPAKSNSIDTITIGSSDVSFYLLGVELSSPNSGMAYSVRLRKSVDNSIVYESVYMSSALSDLNLMAFMTGGEYKVEVENLNQSVALTHSVKIRYMEVAREY